jgi:MFS family permease
MNMELDLASYKVYGYRWVMLLAFMAVAAANQLLWITFASITADSTKYFGVTDLEIGLLSLSFMVVYIITAVPASWVIDTYGIRVAVGIGAALTGVFGLLRGLAAPNYTLVLVAQIGIAIGQPFILNATTKLAARWFPIQERATASGLGSLAVYVGIVAGLALTPYLLLVSNMRSMLIGYGLFSLAAAVLFFAFARENPPSAPCPPGQEARSLVFDGLKQSLRNRNFIYLLVIFFIGLGIFNAVTTWIEDIVRPRMFTSTQAGIAGGLMVLAGVIGAVILPTLSDHYRKRVPFIILAVAGAIPGLIGITYATNYPELLVSAFILGFFLLSAGPLGFQYGAEITFPAPEGMSNGLLLLVGQISGIALIFAMDSFRTPGTGAMTPSLIVLIVLMALVLILCTRLKDSKLLNR